MDWQMIYQLWFRDWLALALMLAKSSNIKLPEVAKQYLEVAWEEHATHNYHIN